MNEKKDWFPAVLGILCGIMAALLVLAFSDYSFAEALPSPTVADLVKLSGDLEISEAPLDLYVLECVRVDVKRIGKDGVWGDLTLPYVPPSIWGVLLFDEFHLLHGSFERTGENALRVHFWPDDVERLDGTVGIYLVILAENEG